MNVNKGDKKCDPDFLTQTPQGYFKRNPCLSSFINIIIQYPHSTVLRGHYANSPKNTKYKHIDA